MKEERETEVKRKKEHHVGEAEQLEMLKAGKVELFVHLSFNTRYSHINTHSHFSYRFHQFRHDFLGGVFWKCSMSTKASEKLFLFV